MPRKIQPRAQHGQTGHVLLPRLRTRDTKRQTQAQEVDAATPSSLKRQLFRLFQRRFICHECAKKHGLPLTDTLWANTIEGTCQACGKEWQILKEVMYGHSPFKMQFNDPRR